MILQPLGWSSVGKSVEKNVEENVEEKRGENVEEKRGENVEEKRGEKLAALALKLCQAKNTCDPCQEKNLFFFACDPVDKTKNASAVTR